MSFYEGGDSVLYLGNRLLKFLLGTLPRVFELGEETFQLSAPALQSTFRGATCCSRKAASRLSSRDADSPSQVVTDFCKSA